MIKVRVFTIGKNKHSWLEPGLQDYEKRLKGYMSIEWLFFKNDEDMLKAIDKEKNIICLDPKGSSYTSEEFSLRIEKLLSLNGASLTFCIGGSDGLPVGIKNQARELISLSKLTFTHQMTRLILIEQLYRAKEISEGSPYHK
jgi:23S rRNA (pseudouridine1915-N3)-methyltransferase